MIEIIDLSQRLMSIADRVFGSIGEYKTATKIQRERLAGLCDSIADCNSRISESMKHHAVPQGLCSEILVYSEELPRLLTQRYVSRTLFNDLQHELQAVYDTLGQGLFLEGDTKDSDSDWDLLASVAEAAAGKFRACANILRAM